MKGYYTMPEKTAETIIDGWLHTGDIGYIDARGFVYIKDRIRDVVVTGGFNVYPNDVEAVLGQHPDVSECVVFGLPDPKWGEAVHAAVELTRGANTDEAALIAFVKSRLDSVKAPKRVHVTDQLPRSPVGKVLRREARVKFAESE
jgi:fatty-acyl-CoA synthase